VQEIKGYLKKLDLKTGIVGFDFFDYSLGVSGAFQFFSAPFSRFERKGEC